MKEVSFEHLIQCWTRRLRVQVKSMNTVWNEKWKGLPELSTPRIVVVIWQITIINLASVDEYMILIPSAFYGWVPNLSIKIWLLREGYYLRWFAVNSNVHLNCGENVQILYVSEGENRRFVISCVARKERIQSLLIGIRVDSSKYWSLLMDSPGVIVIISNSIEALPTLIISTLIDSSERI